MSSATRRPLPAFALATAVAVGFAALAGCAGAARRGPPLPPPEYEDSPGLDGGLGAER